MISVKIFYSRRKEYNQHEPSQFHSRDATDGICTCIRMFGIAVNKAQQLSLAMEILAKGKKKKENQSERKFKWFELQYFIARDTWWKMGIDFCCHHCWRNGRKQTYISRMDYDEGLNCNFLFEKWRLLTKDFAQFDTWSVCTLSTSDSGWWTAFIKGSEIKLKSQVIRFHCVDIAFQQSIRINIDSAIRPI